MNPTRPPSDHRRVWTRSVAAGCVLLGVCLLGAGTLGAAYLFAQRSAASSQPAVEYVIDASPRMALPAEAGTGTRLAVAESVLAEVVRPADPALTAGLRVFGSGKLSDACADTDLLVPLARANQAKISDQLQAVRVGSQPDAAMGNAVVAALRDLATTKGPHTLVVITGGSDSCNAQAGQLIADEAKRAGIDFQLFVVGYLVPSGEGSGVSGLVDSLGNGHYVNASSQDQLKTVLTAIQKYVNSPKAATVAGILATAAALPTPAFGQTACDNPYLPVRAAATWQYTYSDGATEVWNVTGVAGDNNSALAHLTIDTSQGQQTGDWHCAGGAISKYDLPHWFTASPNQTVVSSDGPFLPAASQLVPGANWETHYTLTYDSSDVAGTHQILEVVTETYAYGGAEPVTVAGTTYAALRVDGTRTADFSAPGQSNVSIPTSHYVDKLQIWFARGVGLVKLVSQFQQGIATGQDYTEALTSFRAP